jgi:hypothetical protein
MRVHTARNEPILKLPAKKIHGYGQQSRRNSPRQQHPHIVEVDASEDQFT